MESDRADGGGSPKVDGRKESRTSTISSIDPNSTERCGFGEFLEIESGCLYLKLSRLLREELMEEDFMRHTAGPGSEGLVGTQVPCPRADGSRALGLGSRRDGRRSGGSSVLARGLAPSGRFGSGLGGLVRLRAPQE